MSIVQVAIEKIKCDICGSMIKKEGADGLTFVRPEKYLVCRGYITLEENPEKHICAICRQKITNQV